MPAAGGGGGGGAGSGRGTLAASLHTALFLLFSAGTVVAVAARTRSKKRRRAISYAVGPDGKHVDIGAIFGLDVGGTLSKLVYFEQTRKSRSVERVTNSKRRFRYFEDPKKSAMKRSQSLENLNTPRHTKALDAFYDFMQAEGSPVRAELRDDNLSFFSRVLGGELHFMRFETRHMERVVDIVKSNRLHHSINTMGCTGGGAYKFSEMFQERLGITLRKMDELECLMRGLEFVLQHVVGECYTYKPDRAPNPAPSPLSASFRRGASSLSHPPPHPSPASTVASSDADGPGLSVSIPPHGHSQQHPGGMDQSWGGGSSIGSTTPEASPRLRASSASSSGGLGGSAFPPMPQGSPRGSGGGVGERERELPPRIPPRPTSGANAGNNLKQEWKYKVQRSGENVIYPYLVVNIGSGVSILKVEAPGKYERVSGSSLGGGTYWGLCRLLTRCKTFDEVLDLADLGDATSVDMTVGDIYGRGYDKFHLGSSVVASSFGKLAMKQEPGEGIREEDMARALLMMITGNIAQVAYLNAVIYRATHIYFVGNFLRHNKISCRRLAYAIDYWSAGKMEALFLEHEGYFGSLGAFLTSSYAEDLRHQHSQEQQQQQQQQQSSSSSGDSANGPGVGSPTGSGGGGAQGARLRRQQTYAVGEPVGGGMPRRKAASMRLEQSYAGGEADWEEHEQEFFPSAAAAPQPQPPGPGAVAVGEGAAAPPVEPVRV